MKSQWLRVGYKFFNLANISYVGFGGGKTGALVRIYDKMSSATCTDHVVLEGEEAQEFYAGFMAIVGDPLQPVQPLWKEDATQN